MGEPSPTAKGRGDRDSPTLPALESLSVDELRQHLEELRRLQKDQRVREQQQQLQLQQLLLLQQQQQQPSPPLPQLVTPFSALDAHTASVCVPQVSSDLYRTAGLGSVGFAGGYPLGAGSADVVNRAGVVPVPIAAAAGVGSMGSAGHIAAPAPTHPQTTLDQQLAASLQQQQRQQQQQQQQQAFGSSGGVAHRSSGEPALPALARARGTPLTRVQSFHADTPGAFGSLDGGLDRAGR